MRALKGAGIILAVIVGVVALIFLLALYTAGLLWVSKNVLDYLNIAAAMAFAACAFVLLPLALFQSTRKVSAYGFFISSVIFGVSTWVLGFLVTFQYWGVTGLFVGLFLAGVGVVPIGILASAFNGEWPQVGDLTLGLVLTFGARAIVYLLAQRMDHDEAGSNSNSSSTFTTSISRSMSYATERWGALVRFDRIQSQQIIITVMCLLIGGGFAVHGALHPSRSNYDYLQLVANLNAHPIASVLGALLPAILFSPLVYWMSGWVLRRNAAHFKVCEHCAETIKAQAKVCRYCGRDVAPARQGEVTARHGVDDEQHRPGADVNRIEPVQVASSAANASIMTYEAQSSSPWPLSRPALVTACLLGLFLFGSAGVWLANTQWTPVLSGIPPFDELPSTPMPAGSLESANAAYGRGDYTTTLRLLRPLAEQGNPAAQTNLGLMYYEGRGAQQNSTEAVKWWRKAAEQGFAQAQYNLGLMYDEGRGLQQNYVWAHMWYNLAAKQGDRDAIKNRDMVAQLMTPAQINEALRLARAWQSEKLLSDADFDPDAYLAGTSGRK